MTPSEWIYDVHADHAIAKACSVIPAKGLNVCERYLVIADVVLTEQNPCRVEKTRSADARGASSTNHCMFLSTLDLLQSIESATATPQTLYYAIFVGVKTSVIYRISVYMARVGTRPTIKVFIRAIHAGTMASLIENSGFIEKTPSCANHNLAYSTQLRHLTTSNRKNTIKFQDVL